MDDGMKEWVNVGMRDEGMGEQWGKFNEGEGAEKVESLDLGGNFLKRYLSKKQYEQSRGGIGTQKNLWYRPFL